MNFSYIPLIKKNTIHKKVIKGITEIITILLLSLIEPIPNKSGAEKPVKSKKIANKYPFISFLLYF